MTLRNKLIQSLSEELKIDVPECVHPLIDMLTIDKRLKPLDFLAVLIYISVTTVGGHKASTIELEDLYKEQRNCVDSYFKFHTNNLKSLRELKGLSDSSYVREDHFFDTGEDLPVSLKEVVDAIKLGYKGDLSGDLNKPLYNLILITIYASYYFYGYSKELEEDVNNMFYNHDKKLVNIQKELGNKDV